MISSVIASSELVARFTVDAVFPSGPNILVEGGWTNAMAAIATKPTAVLISKRRCGHGSRRSSVESRCKRVCSRSRCRRCNAVNDASGANRSAALSSASPRRASMRCASQRGSMRRCHCHAMMPATAIARIAPDAIPAIPASRLPNAAQATIHTAEKHATLATRRHRAATPAPATRSGMPLTDSLRDDGLPKFVQRQTGWR